MEAELRLEVVNANGQVLGWALCQSSIGLVAIPSIGDRVVLPFSDPIGELVGVYPIDQSRVVNVEHYLGDDPGVAVVVRATAHHYPDFAERIRALDNWSWTAARPSN